MNRISILSLGLVLTTLPASALAESQIIARLKPGVDPVAVANRAGVVVRDRTPDGPFVLFALRGGQVADTVQARLLTDSNVVWAEDNVDVDSPESTSVARTKGSSLSVIGGRDSIVTKNTSALSQIDWSSSLANGNGRTVKIAILDTGLSRRQTALWSKVDAYLDLDGGNADDAPTGVDSTKNGQPDEAVGHGTMVAGIVDMVAPKVRFVIAKVADSDGRSTAWRLIRGLTFAAAQHAEIANLSMGSSTSIAAINDYMDWLVQQGTLLVAPVGNANVQRPWSPSNNSKVVCVAGLNPDSTKAFFSNWDSAVDASAPAVSLVSQWWDGTLASWSGTSFAAPFVAATLADALRHTASPLRDPRSLIDLVRKSGRSIDNVNKNYKGKLGTLLDFAALLRSLGVRP